MRIHLILSTLLLFSLSAFSQYNIRGEVLHHEGQILLLAPTLSGACDTLGNAVTVDGAFSFKGMIYQPAYAEIQIVGVTPSFPIFLEKGNFEFKVDVQHPLDYEITGGGELQCLRNEFKVKELNLKYERDSIYAEYKKQYEKGDLFGDMQIRDLFQKYEELYSKTEDEFIREHDNLVSVSLIAGRYKKLLREKTLPGKYALLGEKARNSIQGQWLKPYVDKITRIIPGGIAPDLEMQTPEGKIMSVYSVKSKVKILDFGLPGVAHAEQKIQICVCFTNNTKKGGWKS